MHICQEARYAISLTRKWLKQCPVSKLQRDGRQNQTINFARQTEIFQSYSLAELKPASYIQFLPVGCGVALAIVIGTSKRVLKLCGTGIHSNSRLSFNPLHVETNPFETTVNRDSPTPCAPCRQASNCKRIMQPQRPVRQAPESIQSHSSASLHVQLQLRTWLGSLLCQM